MAIISSRVKPISRGVPLPLTPATPTPTPALLLLHDGAREYKLLVLEYKCPPAPTDGEAREGGREEDNDRRSGRGGRGATSGCA